MSIGSLGTIGSLTSGQLQQTRGADADRTTQDALTHSHGIDSARKAEQAEGIGETQQDEGAADRDADGRRLWERPAEKSKPEEAAEQPAAETMRSVDPTGQAGGNLDLVG